MPLPEITWTPEFKETHAYYDRDNEEILNFDSIGEYISEEWLNYNGSRVEELITENPTIEVIAYQRMRPTREECSFIDSFFERIDEERGDPDGSAVEERITDMAAVIAAEQAFIDVFLANYTPWACEAVLKINVPFRVWFEAQSEKYQASLREG